METEARLIRKCSSLDPVFKNEKKKNPKNVGAVLFLRVSVKVHRAKAYNLITQTI